jgi:hypothetical protein
MFLPYIQAFFLASILSLVLAPIKDLLMRFFSWADDRLAHLKWKILVTQLSVTGPIPLIAVSLGLAVRSNPFWVVLFVLSCVEWIVIQMDRHVLASVLCVAGLLLALVIPTTVSRALTADAHPAVLRGVCYCHHRNCQPHRADPRPSGYPPHLQGTRPSQSSNRVSTSSASGKQTTLASRWLAWTSLSAP